MASADRLNLDSEHRVQVAEDGLEHVLGSSKQSPEAASYLSHLTSLSLESVVAEPTNLNSTSAQITNALTTLCNTSYPTFLSLHSASTSLSSTLTSLSSSLSTLLSTLPELQSTATSFAQTTTPLLAERRQALLVSDHAPKLTDLLDLPRLFDTCVRTGAIADALDIAQHGAQLAQSFSDVALVQDVNAELAAAQRALLGQLLAQLAEPGKGRLPTLFKAVGFLRRLQVLAEDELALAFIASRRAALVSSLAALEADRRIDADRDRDGGTRFVKAFVEAWREGVYDVVTQFTTIFLDRALAGSSLTSPSPTAPAVDQELTATLRALLTTFTNSMLARLLSVLQTYALPIRQHDPAGLSALLTQLTYCASSFARVGLDFRALVAPTFIEAVRIGVRGEIELAVETFNHSFELDRQKPLANEWLVVSNAATNPPMAGLASGTAPHVVPQTLAAYPPLAELTNALLTALNGLRLLAPADLLPELSITLDGALNRSGRVFMEWAKGRCEESDVDAELKVIAAMGHVYADVFVPFMRRALVEGVYSATLNEADGELAATLQALKEWVGGSGFVQGPVNGVRA